MKKCWAVNCEKEGVLKDSISMPYNYLCPGHMRKVLSGYAFNIFYDEYVNHAKEEKTEYQKKMFLLLQSKLKEHIKTYHEYIYKNHSADCDIFLAHCVCSMHQEDDCSYLKKLGTCDTDCKKEE